MRQSTGIDTYPGWDSVGSEVYDLMFGDGVITSSESLGDKTTLRVAFNLKDYPDHNHYSDSHTHIYINGIILLNHAPAKAITLFPRACKEQLMALQCKLIMACYSIIN